MEIFLAIATILGGVSAVWYFWDKYWCNREWREKEKVVNSNWWESSELKHTLEARGLKLRWSNRDRIEERKEKGYEIIYEEDKTNRTRYILVNSSDQVLIGKRDS
jgi:hypothetical protein